MTGVAFAGPTALEVIRKTRLSTRLVLTPAEKVDQDLFRNRRRDLCGTNFSALGLSSEPTKGHPAWIRAVDAGGRKRASHLRGLTFPKRMPPNALLQLKYRVEAEVPANHPKSEQGHAAFTNTGKASPNPTAEQDEKLESLFDRRYVYLDSVPLACLCIAARYQQLIRADKLTEGDAVVRLVELMMEFAGHYGRDPADPVSGSVAESLPAVTTIGDIRLFVKSTSHVLGISLLRKALDHARDGSRSPMETCLWVVLTLPEEYGLFSLGSAKLNAAMVPTQAQRSLMHHHTLTPDILWEREGTAVEYQGEDGHTGRTAKAEDNRRLNDYQVCGVRAHFVTFDDVRTREGVDRLAASIVESMRIHGFPEEEKRIRRLLQDDEAAIMRARHLAHLLPPVRRS